MSDAKTGTIEPDPTSTLSKDQTINNETMETPAVVDPDENNAAGGLTEEKMSTNNFGEVKSEIKSLSEVKALSSPLRGDPIGRATKRHVPRAVWPDERQNAIARSSFPRCGFRYVCGQIAQIVRADRRKSRCAEHP